MAGVAVIFLNRTVHDSRLKTGRHIGMAIDAASLGFTGARGWGLRRTGPGKHQHAGKAQTHKTFR
jgi:hypothetical protein